jgi:nitroreductase
MDDLYTPLAELCRRRHSVRLFEDRPVPVDAVAKIKEIALTSPYASGRKNWKLEIVDDPELIKRLVTITESAAGKIASGLRSDFRPMFQTYARSFSAFASAPLLVIPVYKAFATLSYMQNETSDDILQWERDNYVKSIACVAMLILLAAESLGLGACFMTGPLLAEEHIKGAIGLRHNQHIGAIIPVGYPAITTGR